MSFITLRGVPPWDGTYEFDVDRSFTTRELRWMKQIAGYLPVSLQEGLEGGDADVVITLVCIAMHRAGKLAREDVLDVADRMSDLPVGDEDTWITIDSTGDEVDELPPAPPLEHEPSSPSLSNERPSSSGPPLPISTASQGETPEATGDGNSHTSPVSSPTGSVT